MRFSVAGSAFAPDFDSSLYLNTSERVFTPQKEFFDLGQGSSLLGRGSLPPGSISTLRKGSFLVGRSFSLGNSFSLSAHSLLLVFRVFDTDVGLSRLVSRFYPRNRCFSSGFGLSLSKTIHLGR